MIAAFGDSLTAEETYQFEKSWLHFLQEGPLGHTLLGNHAEGGSVSGQDTDYVYSMNGTVLETKGLLGQVNDRISAGISSADTAIIWSGANDLIVGSILDPFTTQSGMNVTTNPVVTNFRDVFMNVQDHSEAEYGEFIVDNYTTANIATAIDMLKNAGVTKIIVFGPFDMSQTAVAGSKTEQVYINCYRLRDKLYDLCINRGVFFVDNIIIPVYTMDEVHLSEASQHFIFENLITQVYGV